ncbi:hypothetical protein BDFG_05086 [Blastomyces dermatitidis ATCC 26199]|nr:hypothetical protein BDFG_05086 [Blastomyces dermatitidis ATCC 26199]
MPLSIDSSGYRETSSAASASGTAMEGMSKAVQGDSLSGREALTTGPTIIMRTGTASTDVDMKLMKYSEHSCCIIALPIIIFGGGTSRNINFFCRIIIIHRSRSRRRKKSHPDRSTRSCRILMWMPPC